MKSSVTEPTRAELEICPNRARAQLKARLPAKENNFTEISENLYNSFKKLQKHLILDKLHPKFDFGQISSSLNIVAPSLYYRAVLYGLEAKSTHCICFCWLDRKGEKNGGPLWTHPPMWALLTAQISLRWPFSSVWKRLLRFEIFSTAYGTGSGCTTQHVASVLHNTFHVSCI